MAVNRDIMVQDHLCCFEEDGLKLFFLYMKLTNIKIE